MPVFLVVGKKMTRAPLPCFPRILDGDGDLDLPHLGLIDLEGGGR